MLNTNISQLKIQLHSQLVSCRKNYTCTHHRLELPTYFLEIEIDKSYKNIVFGPNLFTVTKMPKLKEIPDIIPDSKRR